jgi:class 3 adenylate cyclase
MDFYELLDHVLELLRQRERVTYRALKRQFHLDDEVLDDLKEEILYGQRLAVEEDGRVLVWTGGAGAAPPAISSPPSFGEVAQVDQWTRVAPPPSAAYTPEAERRQFTVLFCDLVDSTALASQLNPEEWCAVVRAYQDTCAKVIARYEGHIAQYLGDGLLVYFGYPLAHEDDAPRAVWAGLGMVEAVGQLTISLQPEKSIRLAVRVGIHTGLVVVGRMGSGNHQERLAWGTRPTLRLGCKASRPRIGWSSASVPSRWSGVRRSSPECCGGGPRPGQARGRWSY